MPRAFNSSAGFWKGGTSAEARDEASYPGSRAGSLADSPGVLGCLCRLWAIVGGGM